MDATSPSQPYLGYLKTEMTIMGVLSAFSAAAGGVGAEKLLTAEQGTVLKAMWYPAQNYWLLGFAAWLLSSLLFYRQRSFLAFLYGQLALCDTPGRPASLPKREDLLKRCDSWETWICYRQAFLAIMIAVLFHTGALIVALAEAKNRIAWSARISTVALLIVPAIVGFAVLQQYVFTKFATEVDPWRQFFDSLRRSTGSANRHQRH